MSSSNLNRSTLAVDTVTETILESPTERTLERGGSVVLTTRAAVVIAVLGGGVWYLLWKASLHFLVGH
jgi:hypothetical protein